MCYKISEKELENVNLFVPSWFSEALMAGVCEEDLKETIRENLTAAYEMAGREPLEDQKFNEKIDDLYAVYKDSLEGCKIGEGSNE